jgi:TonB family protein
MSQRNERSQQPGISGVTHWLIHQAAHRAPENLPARLEEEWLADLESRSAALSRLRFALGCCWATLVIANEYPSSRVAATSPAAVSGGFISLADRNFRYFSLRSATLFLIAGLHAALFFGLIATLSHTRGNSAPPNLQNNPVAPLPRVKEPRPVPGAEFKNWTISVPKPILDSLPKINISPDVISGDTENPPKSISPPLLPETPTRVVQRLAGGPGAGFPETADFYPSPSIRLGEEGISTVSVCVDSRGRLTSEPTIMNRSGSARLDEAALKLARAGSGHYRASTEDGQPVSSCYAFGVRFQLRR